MNTRKPTQRAKDVAVTVQRVVGRRQKLTDDQLCKMIREAVADRPDLNPRNKMRLTRIEMLDGKPVRCYIETKPPNAEVSGQPPGE